MTSRTALIARTVQDLMAPPPPVAHADTSCARVVEMMVAARSSCLLVVDDGHVIGIVTERDVTRRMAFRTSPDAPISGVMTSPVHTTSTDDYLYQAIGIMRRHDLRHLPVVDGQGKVVGMLNLRQSMADASADIVARIDALSHEGTSEGLGTVKAAEAEVASVLLDDGAPPEDIQSLISYVNNDIYRRVTAAALAAMERDGKGPPPVPFAVIVMGSGGRGENMLRPDQDNGMIVADYADADHHRIDGWFIDLAERMTGDLAAAGFPLCNGGVMATNPLWRKTLTQWREQTRLWARRRGTAAVRLGDIFFDFAPVYGNTGLAEELRRHVTALMRNNIAFLQEVNRDQAEFHSALNFFGRFTVERDSGPFRGWINIKHGGTLRLVNAVRILALRDGIAETGTLARIAALRERGAFDADETEDIVAAFRHFNFLVLRQQIEAMSAGAPVGNCVPPKRLSRREKRELKDAFRIADRLRDGVAGEITGNVLTGASGSGPG